MAWRAHSEATEIPRKALREHGTFRKHYEALCARCDEAMGAIARAVTAFE